MPNGDGGCSFCGAEGTPEGIEHEDGCIELGEPDSLKGTWWEKYQEYKEFVDWVFGEDVFSVELNCNDFFDYACSDYVRVMSDDLDIYWMAKKKFGAEGGAAFKCFAKHLQEPEYYSEMPEPLSEYFSRGYLDRKKFDEAVAWLNEIHCCWTGFGMCDTSHFETKECCFGWKVDRPMYSTEDPEGGPSEKYW
jgi:hypothetical protein